MPRLLLAATAAALALGAATPLQADETCNSPYLARLIKGQEDYVHVWTLGVREGKLSENQFVAVLATNQARIYGAYPKKGTLAPGADADIVLWDPELSTTTTVGNRHGNVDYTPYEGRSFIGGPAAVYVRGNLVYKDGEVVGERGSGRFVELQGTGEEATFDAQELAAMIALAERGIAELAKLQQRALAH